MPFARRPGFLDHWTVEDFDKRKVGCRKPESLLRRTYLIHINMADFSFLKTVTMDDGEQVTKSRDLEHKTSYMYSLCIILSMKEDRIYSIHRKTCEKIGRPKESTFLFTRSGGRITGKYAYYRFNKVKIYHTEKKIHHLRLSLIIKYNLDIWFKRFPQRRQEDESVCHRGRKKG